MIFDLYYVKLNVLIFSKYCLLFYMKLKIWKGTTECWMTEFMTTDRSLA